MTHHFQLICTACTVPVVSLVITLKSKIFVSSGLFVLSLVFKSEWSDAVVMMCEELMK